MYVALQSARAYTYAVAKVCDRGQTTRFDAAEVTGRTLQSLSGS